MRKAMMAAAVAALFCAPAGADQWVDGYYRNDGTHVPGHNRSDPDGSRLNNYSTEGNINPYTGERGTKPRVEEPDWGLDTDRDYGW